MILHIVFKMPQMAPANPQPQNKEFHSEDTVSRRLLIVVNSRIEENYVLQGCSPLYAHWQQFCQWGIT